MLTYLVMTFLIPPINPLPIVDIPIDSLVSDVEAPDDVEVLPTIIKVPKPYPVYRDTGSTKVIVDTIYQLVEVTNYRSRKLFNFPQKESGRIYASSLVTAWALSPVDSFKNDLKIDWKGYFEDNVKPVYDLDFKRRLNRSKWRWFWFGVGGTATAIILMNS